MFVRPQRAAAPWSDGHWWGKYTDAASLPNKAASEIQLPDVQEGDVAWSVAEGALYVCTDPTPGAALWEPLAFGGGTTAMSDTLIWGNDNIAASATTRYLVPGWDALLAPTSPRQFRISRAGTLSELRVHHNAPGGNGTAVTYTLRVNGVPTALSATLASTAADASDLVNSVAVVAGDLLGVEVTRAGNIGGGTIQPSVSVRFT